MNQAVNCTPDSESVAAPSRATLTVTSLSLAGSMTGLSWLPANSLAYWPQKVLREKSALALALLDPEKMNARHYSTFRLAIWGSLLAIILLIVLAIWAFSPAHYALATHSQLQFPVQISFPQLKQALSSADAIPAMVEFSGLQLLDQRLEERETNASEDPQSVLSTLMGRPPADVRLERQLLARVLVPEFGTEQVSLMQTIRIDDDVVEVTTTANLPSGNLENYRHHLLVQRPIAANSPQVTLSLDVTPRVEVARALRWIVERRLQQLIDQALETQRRELERLFAAQSNEDLPANMQTNNQQLVPNRS